MLKLVEFVLLVYWLAKWGYPQAVCSTVSPNGA